MPDHLHSFPRSSLLGKLLSWSVLHSSRPCPRCGNAMAYRAGLSTCLSGRYIRVCLEPDCRFIDARKVKLTGGGLMDLRRN
jgi:hypothetical protein